MDTTINRLLTKFAVCTSAICCNVVKAVVHRKHQGRVFNQILTLAVVAVVVVSLAVVTSSALSLASLTAAFCLVFALLREPLSSPPWCKKT
jgi:hypothetical protein